MKKETVRVYIDVYSPIINDPYKLCLEMNSLFSLIINKSKINLRTGSFHLLDKSDFYDRYVEISNIILKNGSKDIDKLLDEQDEIWFKIPAEERKLLKSHYFRPKNIDFPPTRFKVGQIINYVSDVWEILYLDRENMIIKVLFIGPDEICSIGSYLNINQNYELFRHMYDGYSEIWEIPSEQMKRKDSQILLFWYDENLKPSIEMDF